MSVAEQIAYLIRQGVITIDNVAQQYKSDVEKLIGGEK